MAGPIIYRYHGPARIRSDRRGISGGGISVAFEDNQLAKLRSADPRDLNAQKRLLRGIANGKITFSFKPLDEVRIAVEPMRSHADPEVKTLAGDALLKLAEGAPAAAPPVAPPLPSGFTEEEIFKYFRGPAASALPAVEALINRPLGPFAAPLRLIKAAMGWIGKASATPELQPLIAQLRERLRAIQRGVDFEVVTYGREGELTKFLDQKIFGSTQKGTVSRPGEKNPDGLAVYRKGDKIYLLLVNGGRDRRGNEIAANQVLESILLGIEEGKDLSQAIENAQAQLAQRNESVSEEQPKMAVVVTGAAIENETSVAVTYAATKNYMGSCRALVINRDSASELPASALPSAVKLKTGDSLLLLSNGFDSLSSERIKEILKQGAEKNLPIDEVVRQLKEEALEKQAKTGGIGSLSIFIYKNDFEELGLSSVIPIEMQPEAEPATGTQGPPKVKTLTGIGKTQVAELHPSQLFAAAEEKEDLVEKLAEKTRNFNELRKAAAKQGMELKASKKQVADLEAEVTRLNTRVTALEEDQMTRNEHHSTVVAAARAEAQGAKAELGAERTRAQELAARYKELLTTAQAQKTEIEALRKAQIPPVVEAPTPAPSALETKAVLNYFESRRSMLSFSAGALRKKLQDAGAALAKQQGKLSSLEGERAVKLGSVNELIAQIQAELERNVKGLEAERDQKIEEHRGSLLSKLADKWGKEDISQRLTDIHSDPVSQDIKDEYDDRIEQAKSKAGRRIENLEKGKVEQQAKLEREIAEQSQAIGETQRAIAGIQAHLTKAEEFSTALQALEGQVKDLVLKINAWLKQINSEIFGKS